MFPEFFIAERTKLPPLSGALSLLAWPSPEPNTCFLSGFAASVGMEQRQRAGPGARDRGANLTLHLLGSQETVVTSGNLGIGIWALVWIIYINMK